jgi:hypothetical protein
MVSRVGSSRTLPDSAVRSQARGGVELAQQMAGKARELYELACGESAVEGEPPFTPANPQGEVGCDLSGPPWGSALLHPIFWWSWLGDDTDVTQPDNDLIASSVGGSHQPAVVRAAIWVRPFADVLPGGGIAPYSRGIIWVRGHRSSGGGAAQLIGRARNVTLGQTSLTASAASAGATTSSTTEIDLFTSADDFFMKLRPGLNEIELIFLCETLGNAIAIDSLSILQLAKRSH